MNVNGEPFRKCRECKSRKICRRTRTLLSYYYIRIEDGAAGRAWPWEHGTCPALLLFPDPKHICPECGGTGWVAEPKSRGTVIYDNSRDLDIGLFLSRLPIRERNAITAWIRLGELQDMKINKILAKIRVGRAHFRRRLCNGLHCLAHRFRQEHLL